MEINQKTKITISAELSNRIGAFSFLSALLIVLLHCTPRPSAGGYGWWLATLLGRDGLCRIAVPFFFLVSGFFIGGHVYEQGWWRREIVKRVKSLLVPYAVWIVIGFMFNCLLWFAIEIYGHKSDFQCPFYHPLSLWLVNIIGLNPFTNSIGVLWYVRDLFLLVVASPIIVFVLKKGGWILVMALFGVYCLTSVSLVGRTNGLVNCFEYFFTLRGLTYFTLGIALRYSRISKSVSLPFNTGIAFLSGSMFLLMKCIFIQADQMEWATIADCVMVPLLCAGLFQIAKDIRLPHWLVDNAFAVYLIHTKVLLLSLPLIVIFGARKMLGESIALCLIRFAVAVTISLFTAVLLKRFFPRFAKLMFGGR